MNKYFITLLGVLFTFCVTAQSGDTLNSYRSALAELDSMLAGKKECSFKRAVFVSENAYFNYRLVSSQFYNVVLIA